MNFELKMYRSFLMRVWIENDVQNAVEWQAEIKQIQSGESWSFTNRETLLNFLQAIIGNPDKEIPHDLTST